MWESQDDSGIATVKELDQRYVLCPLDTRDAFLVQVINVFRTEVDKEGSVIVFTDTCK